MKKQIYWYSLLFLGFILLTLVLTIFEINQIIDISSKILTSLRGMVLLGLIIYSIKKRSLTVWILVSLLAGAEFGYDFPLVAKKIGFLTEIFLRLIKTIIAPLLFATLVNGIAGHTNLRQVGRMGWKSLLYFEVVSTIALIIGLFAINISKAGVGLKLELITNPTHIEATKIQSVSEFILHIFPENIAKAVFEGNILQIVLFSIIFGIAVAMLKDTYKQPMIKFTASLAETMFKFTNIIMYYAPIAVFAAIAYAIGQMGTDVLFSLFKLLSTLYIALLFFLVVILLPIALFFKIPVSTFISAVSKPASIAFATSNSESALPSAMESMEKFGVPRKIVSFVIPTGYSFNLDGSTLYLSLASIFVAQVAGIELSIEKQLLIGLTLMLTSKGVAGVSRASLVILLGTLTNFGLPVEPVLIILGIDVLMDMGRTSVNVIGNCLACTVIARWEGEFNDEVANNYKNESEVS